MAEFSWAYIDSTAVVSASGPTGSIQYRVADSGGNTSIAGSSNLVYHTASSLLAITGSVEISGTLTANQYNVNVIDKTVTNISASGDTIFGDTADDTHQFTGSVYVNGPLSASANISASAYYGDGSTLSNITATSISGAMGQFNTNSGLLITSGNAYLGDGASDITTVASQLTASQGALFNEQVMIVDDKNLVFGDQGDSIIKYDEAGSDTLIVSGSSTGLYLGGGSVIIDSPLTRITGAVEITGSDAQLLILHALDADATREIVFKKDGTDAASMVINSSEHLFIQSEQSKDIIFRTNSENPLRVFGSTKFVGIGNKTSANADLDVDGDVIVSGSLTVSGSSTIGMEAAHVSTFVGQITASQGAAFGEQVAIADDKNMVFGTDGDAVIKYDEASTNRLVISGSATGIELMGGSIGMDYSGGTVVSGTAGGAGSFLALNSSHQVVVTTPAAGNPFPLTGDVVATGSLTIVSGSTQVLEVDSSDEGLGAVRGRMLHNISSGFYLTNGTQADAGRYIDIGYNRSIVSNTLDYRNGFLAPSSGRLVSVTYWFPAAAAKQDPSKGQPNFELKVGDVNTLNGGTIDSSLSVVGQVTASSWPGYMRVGGINVLNGQGTLGGTNTTGTFAFGTGSIVGLRFYSGDSTDNNYPGISVVTTVWEFDQLDPYISGSGN